MVEYLNDLARITSKEFAITYFSKKKAPSRMLVLQDKERLVGLGKNVHTHFVRSVNSVAKDVKRMVTKVQWLC